MLEVETGVSWVDRPLEDILTALDYLNKRYDDEQPKHRGR